MCSEFSIVELLAVFSKNVSAEAKDNKLNISSRAQFNKLCDKMWSDMQEISEKNKTKQVVEEIKKVCKKKDKDSDKKSDKDKDDIPIIQEKKSFSSSKKSIQESEDESDEETDYSSDESDSEKEELPMSDEVEDALDSVFTEWDVYDDDIEGKMKKNILEKLIGHKVSDEKQYFKTSLMATSKHLVVRYRLTRYVKKEIGVSDLSPKFKLIHSYILNDM